MKDEVHAKICGFIEKMSSFELMCGTMVVIKVFGKYANLAKTLQSVNVTATGALKCVQKLISSLQDIRTSDEFEGILS